MFSIIPVVASILILGRTTDQFMAEFREEEEPGTPYVVKNIIGRKERKDLHPVGQRSRTIHMTFVHNRPVLPDMVHRMGYYPIKRSCDDATTRLRAHFISPIQRKIADGGKVRSRLLF